MSALLKIRKLFQPIQPRATEGGDCVQYTEVLPDASLSGYICCYWQLDSARSLPEGFQYTVVTDGCIDIFFDLDVLEEKFVMGFSSEHTSFQLKENFTYAGVRFFPGAFPLLFNVKASELTNQCEHLGDVIPKMYTTLNERLDERSSIAAVKPVLDSYFRTMLQGKQAYDMDSRLATALHAILCSNGAFNIQQLDTGISARHLRRLFDFYIGVAPKEFHKIMRFQKLLRRSPTRAMLRDEKFYYDLGYYDQSHFVKDFKSLYGVVPRKAFI